MLEIMGKNKKLAAEIKQDILTGKALLFQQAKDMGFGALDHMENPGGASNVADVDVKFTPGPPQQLTGRPISDEVVGAIDKNFEMSLGEGFKSPDIAPDNVKEETVASYIARVFDEQEATMAGDESPTEGDNNVETENTE